MSRLIWRDMSSNIVSERFRAILHSWLLHCFAAPGRGQRCVVDLVGFPQDSSAGSKDHTVVSGVVG